LKKSSTFFILTLICAALLYWLYTIQNNGLKAFINDSCDFNKCDSCSVDFSKMVKEPISFIYIFYPETTQQEISSAIGFDYPNGKSISDEQRRIVLTSKNKILFEADFSHDEFEFLDENWVQYSKPKMLNNPYKRYKSAKFRVRKNNADDYYLLKQK
jgi:hypothetical protein